MCSNPVGFALVIFIAVPFAGCDPGTPLSAFVGAQAFVFAHNNPDALSFSQWRAVSLSAGAAAAGDGCPHLGGDTVVTLNGDVVDDDRLDRGGERHMVLLCGGYPLPPCDWCEPPSLHIDDDFAARSDVDGPTEIGFEQHGETARIVIGSFLDDFVLAPLDEAHRDLVVEGGDTLRFALPSGVENVEVTAQIAFADGSGNLDIATTFADGVLSVELGEGIRGERQLSLSVSYDLAIDCDGFDECDADGETSWWRLISVR